MTTSAAFVLIAASIAAHTTRRWKMDYIYLRGEVRNVITSRTDETCNKDHVSKPGFCQCIAQCMDQYMFVYSVKAAAIYFQKTGWETCVLLRVISVQKDGNTYSKRGVKLFLTTRKYLRKRRYLARFNLLLRYTAGQYISCL